MQDITKKRILAALGTAEMRAASGENLMQLLCARMGLRRHGKAEWERLRVMLLEMAVRGDIVVEFEPGDSQRLVAAGPPQADGAAELQRLKNENAELHARVQGLQGELQRQAGDVEAAEGLVAEAEVARDTAQGRVRSLEEELQAARQRHAADEQTIRELKAAREALRTAQQELSEQIRELKRVKPEHQEVAPLTKAVQRKPFDAPPIFVASPGVTGTVHMRGNAGEVQEPGCGCVVTRTSTQNCRHGGLNHDFVVICIPEGGSQEAAGAEIARIVARYIKK